MVQRLFTPKGGNYKDIYVADHEPGEAKNITYWRTYVNKEEGWPEIAIGSTITDAVFAEYFALRPTKKQGKRTDMVNVKRALDEGTDLNSLIESNEQAWACASKHIGYFALYQSNIKRRKAFEKPHVEVYYGSTGTGKTRKAYEEMGYDESTTWRWVPQAGTTFYDGYYGQENVIFDEFRGQLPLGSLLTLLDGYPCRVQIKGGSVHWAPKKIILTSPTKPSEWYATVGSDKIDQLLRRIDKSTEFKAIGIA